MYRDKKPRTFFVSLIFAVLAAVISGLFVYYYSVGSLEVEKKKTKEELQSLKNDNDKLKVENEQLKAQAEVSKSSNGSDSKTYTNDKDGYSFSYPSSWFVTKNTEGVVLTNFKYPQANGTELKSDQAKIVIDIKNNPEKLTPKAWSGNAIGENTTILKKGDLKVDGKDAYNLQTKDDTGTSISIYVAKSQTKMIEIINYGSDTELTNIINSFKFL